jgi:hypothetical protein
MAQPQHSPTNIDPWQVAATFAAYLRIAHHIAGRVRLKLVDGALDAPQVRALDHNRLKAAFAGMPGVRDMQINLLARSCTVAYDNAAIPDTAWPDLLAGRRTLAAATLLDLLAAAASSRTTRTTRRKEKTT